MKYEHRLLFRPVNSCLVYCFAHMQILDFILILLPLKRVALRQVEKGQVL